LVATSFKDVAEEVIQTGVFLSRSFGSKLLLLHVMPDTLPASWVDEVGADFMVQELGSKRKQIEAAGCDVEDIMVARGAPAYSICHHAELKDANLIVVGASRGYGGEVRLGVTAERVLRNAIKPVWLVKPGGAMPPHNILCPVDHSNTSRRALENAIQLSRRFGSYLTVMTVSETMPSVYARLMGSDPNVETRESRQVRSDFTEFLEDFDFEGVKWGREVREGNPTAHILSMAEAISCDLIVMGTVGRTGNSRVLLGSVTQKVTRAMPCSVITVDDEDFLRLRLESTITAIEEHLQEAESLLRDGYAMEAVREFEQCLLVAPIHAGAWEGMAAAYEQLGDHNEADRCRQSAKRVRDKVWPRQIDTDQLQQRYLHR
jgi:nucleotide-binding universal stress UspA family protein